MSEIRFYHLQKQTLDQALPLILEKAYQGNHKIVVRLADQKEVERMNIHLWTYAPNKFLPHGCSKDRQSENQPIWLTHKEENPNNATVLVLTQGVQENNIGDYDLCCEMLDGRDETAVNSARNRWKDYKESGHDITYWCQSEQGKWEKKAA